MIKQLKKDCNDGLGIISNPNPASYGTCISEWDASPESHK